MSLSEILKNIPTDIRGNRIEIGDRLIVGQKIPTVNGNRSVVNFARVISINYNKKLIQFTTPKDFDKTTSMSFATVGKKTFMLSKNYFENHASDFKCHSGSIRNRKETININDRVIYVNNDASLSFGRVLSTTENGDVEIIGDGNKRSKVVDGVDVSIKVYMHTKNFFKNHKGNKCYDSHLRKGLKQNQR